MGGARLVVATTEHKPLFRVLNGRSLADIENSRWLNLNEKILGFSFGVIHVPEHYQLGSDAASSYPAYPPSLLKLPCEPAVAGVS